MYVALSYLSFSFSLFFFFFKQKTAYEMRISDWSSVVCSSDLAAYVGWVGSINPAPSQSPVASPAEGTWRSWVDGANPAYGHRTQSPACNQRPAASAVSSGCVLNAMAAPGPALWTALRTSPNRDRPLGGTLGPGPAPRNGTN